MKDFYKTISPKVLEEYAEKAGLGGEYPIDLKYITDNLPKRQCRLLEVGCGTGRLGIHLIKSSNYIGIDSYETYLNYFKNRLKEKNIPFKEKQLQLVSFFDYSDKSFDVILFPWSVIGDFNSKEKQMEALRKAKSLLSEQGMIILDNPAKGSIYNTAPGYEPVMFYFDEWINMFPKLGFARFKQILYTTPTSREREIVILQTN